MAARIGAVAFIHRFGASLNQRVHFHCCVIDRVFEPAVAPDDAPNVSFHSTLAHHLDAAAVADMRAWAHDGGFSVDGSVRIEGADRIGLERPDSNGRTRTAGLERLLRCARPPFALAHLHQRDALHLGYRNPKPARGTAPAAHPTALVLTPLTPIDKIAALVPPPRAHRHRYYGVLALNAALRSVVTALALPPSRQRRLRRPPAPTSAANREESRQRAAARYLWAMPLAHLRGVSAAMPDLPGIDAHHRLRQ